MPDQNPNPRPNLPSVLNDQSTYPQNDQGSHRQSFGSSTGIRLPPISFLSKMPNIQHSQLSQPSSLGSLLNNNSNTQTPSSADANRSSSHDKNAQSPVQSLLNTAENPKTEAKHFPSFISNQTVSNVSSESDRLLNKSQAPQTQLFNDNKSSSLPQSIPLTIQLKKEITKPEVDEETEEEIIKYYENKYGINDFTNEEKHDILQHEKRARIEKAKNPNYKTYLCYSIIKRLNAVPPTKKSSDETPQITENPTEKPVEKSKKFVKNEIIIKNDDVLEFASKFPRKHLGSIVYTPYPTRAVYKQLPFYNGEVSDDDHEIVPLLPDLREHINSIVTIRIPSYQMSDVVNNPNYVKRAIWGTDIYTDDSDILLLLKHNGFLPVIDPELETPPPNSNSEEAKSEPVEKRTPGNLTNKQNITQSVSNFREFVNMISGDIHVDVIVLPPLKKYQGIYRNGVNSRTWDTAHDGVSIAIHGVRYGEKNSAVESVNAVEVKKRKLDEIAELADGSNYERIEGEGRFKLNKEAWTKAKLELEQEKAESKERKLTKDQGKKGVPQEN